MKRIHTINDKNLTKQILDEVEFGTLALCSDNKPYSLPINFVEKDGEVFFHGAKKGRKIDIINSNCFASFSVVDPISFLPSYFSNDEGNASPATHIYKSVMIDGYIEFVEDYDEKIKALGALMQKYQKEGGYKSLDNEMYKKIVNATCIYKLVCIELSTKFYLGQHFNEKRFLMVKENLLKRGTKKDLQTLKLIEEFRILG